MTDYTPLSPEGKPKTAERRLDPSRIPYGPRDPITTPATPGPRQGWAPVCADHPCPICGKDHRCRISPDGKIAACMRNGVGAFRITSGGSHLHRIDPGHEPNSPSWRRSEPHSTPTPCQITAAPIPLADPTTLNQAYRALLAELFLSAEHRRNLEKRGLPASTIDRSNAPLRTLPKSSRTALARRVLNSGLTQTQLLGVPGFALINDETTQNPTLSVVGTAGLLIPVLDINQNIIALRVRVDQPTASNKYRWLSSANYGGPSTSASVHCPPCLSGDFQEPATIILTEGELKAEVTQAIQQIRTISVPGVGLWNRSLPVLQALQPKTIRLAFDADAWENRSVASALASAFRELTELNYHVEILTWNPDLGKGIDDVLIHPQAKFTIKTNQDALALVRQALDKHHQPDPLALRPSLNANQIQFWIDWHAKQNREELYQDWGLITAIAKLRAQDPVGHASISENLRRRRYQATVLKAVLQQRNQIQHRINSQPTGESSPNSNAETANTTLQVNKAPDDPHRLARIYLRSHNLTRYWNGDFYEWSDSCYKIISNDDVKSRLIQMVEAEFNRLNLEEIALWKQQIAHMEEERKPRQPECRKVVKSLTESVMGALRGETCVEVFAQPSLPCWVGDKPSQEWLPESTLVCQNGLIFLPTGEHCPPNPNFFNTNVIPCDYDLNTNKPTLWLEFLNSILPNDTEAIATLQEWFGYVLTPNTSQQKILCITGAKRSGKGTIGRTLTALLGRNTCSMTLNGFSNDPSLASLIGKTLVVVPEMKPVIYFDQGRIVESLLSISGEDSMTIDRKYQTVWQGRLQTRIMLMSNGLPKLADASGALASRMIYLHLTESFLGREDPELEQKILKELPGILLWAIAGYQRLRNRGHFIQPESASSLLDEMSNLSTPIPQFIEDVCVLEKDTKIPTDQLFNAWRRWVADHKIGNVQDWDKSLFGSRLREFFPQIGLSHPIKNPVTTGKIRFYTGIRLKTEGAN